MTHIAIEGGYFVLSANKYLHTERLLPSECVTRDPNSDSSSTTIICTRDLEEIVLEQETIPSVGLQTNPIHFLSQHQ
ncbi:hypothetical protein ACOSQ4_029231 [Xanthoceras sorbifolium]